MKQFTFDEAKAMTYAQLGAIGDPISLQATGFESPILVRYLVRTSQVDARFPGVPVPRLLDAFNVAAVRMPMPGAVAQTVPTGTRDAAVDAYLDGVQPLVLAAL